MTRDTSVDTATSATSEPKGWDGEPMFCFQCEQTFGGVGCTHRAGACGKSAEVANLQDELTGALVGFAMVGFFPREGGGGRLWLDRLLLGDRWQGRGLGRKALEALIAMLMAVYGPQDLYLSIYEDNAHALRLYRQFGFVMNGELDAHGEKVMVRRLT